MVSGVLFIATEWYVALVCLFVDMQTDILSNALV